MTVSRVMPIRMFSAGGRCDNFPVGDQEDVFGAALGHVALVGEHDGLVEAVLHRLAFGKGRVDIRADDFGACGDGVVVDAPPGGDGAAHAAGIDVVASRLRGEDKGVCQVVQSHAKHSPDL